MASSCASFTAQRDSCFHRSFTSAGLRSFSVSLPDGTVIHCWAPRHPDPARPNLLLIHGFGANATWQWDAYLKPLMRTGFNVYVPDLLFFGESYTPLPDRSEIIQVMCTDFVREKTELIYALIKDRKLADLPKINQPTLIIWGEHDQVFPLELGYRLKRHLDGNPQIVVIKNAGHAVNLEKPKELCMHIKTFLVDHSNRGYDKNKARKWRFASRMAGLSMERFAFNRPLLSGEKA